MYRRTKSGKINTDKTRVKNINAKGAGGLKIGDKDLIQQEKAISLVKDEVKKVMKLLNQINIKCVKSKKKD
tara:strand:- start:2347 stop:2559 length:213 start_codon:yes stop_codon:yes gene_type:complete